MVNPMIENLGTTARVSAGFGAKRSLGNYQSADGHASFSLEFDISGKSLAEVMSELQEIQAQLDGLAKQSVAISLGVDYTENAAGVTMVELGTPPADTKPAAAPRQASQGGGGGGGTRPFSPPKVSKDEKEIVVIGGEPYYDNRPFKAQGRYNERAADFTRVNKEGQGQQSLWLQSKNGQMNQETVQLLEESGIDY